MKTIEKLKPIKILENGYFLITKFTREGKVVKPISNSSNFKQYGHLQRTLGYQLQNAKHKLV